MPYVTVGQENSGDVRIYEDHGSGRPIVLIQGLLPSGRGERHRAAVPRAIGTGGRTR